MLLTEKKSNKVAAAAVVAGLLAIILSTIPLVGTPLSFVGIVLAIVGFVLAARGHNGMALSGLGGALSAVGMLIGIANSNADKTSFSAVVEALWREQDSDSSTSTSVETWTHYGDTATSGEFEVRIQQIRIGKVTVIDHLKEEGDSDDDELQIRISAFNAYGHARTYRGAAVVSNIVMAELADREGNHYASGRAAFGKQLKGQAGVEAILPTTIVEDLLVFEVPAPGTGFLVLTLHPEMFDSAETIRFKIPASAIKKAGSN